MYSTKILIFYDQETSKKNEASILKIKFEQRFNEFKERINSINSTIYSMQENQQTEFEDFALEKYLLEGLLKSKKDYDFYINVANQYFERRDYEGVIRIITTQDSWLDTSFEDVERIDKILENKKHMPNTGN